MMMEYALVLKCISNFVIQLTSPFCDILDVDDKSRDDQDKQHFFLLKKCKFIKAGFPSQSLFKRPKCVDAI